MICVFHCFCHCNNSTVFLTLHIASLSPREQPKHVQGNAYKTYCTSVNHYTWHPTFMNQCHLATQGLTWTVWKQDSCSEEDTFSLYTGHDCHNYKNMGQGEMIRGGGHQLKILSKTVQVPPHIWTRVQPSFETRAWTWAITYSLTTLLAAYVCKHQSRPRPATSRPQHNSSKKRLPRPIQHAATVYIQISTSTVANSDHKHVGPANSWKINVPQTMRSRYDCSRIHL